MSPRPWDVRQQFDSKEVSTFRIEFSCHKIMMSSWPQQTTPSAKICVSECLHTSLLTQLSLVATKSIFTSVGLLVSKISATGTNITTIIHEKPPHSVKLTVVRHITIWRSRLILVWGGRRYCGREFQILCGNVVKFSAAQNGSNCWRRGIEAVWFQQGGAKARTPRNPLSA